jgi:hypothetical protein
MNWSELWCRLGTLALELLLITWLVRRFSRKLKRRKEK